MREQLMFVFRFLAPQSMVQGPAESVSPESLLEMQVVVSHPKPTESEPALRQDAQMVSVHTNILEVL